MDKKILLFGGSGFIGSALVKRMLTKGYSVTVVCSDFNKAKRTLGEHKLLNLQCIDIFQQDKLQSVINDNDVVINLIGKLFERQKGDFLRFHYEFPKLLSNCLLNRQLLIHFSALGIKQSRASSVYAQTKWEGQNVIMQNCKKFCVIQPSLVFGSQDNFFNLFGRLSKCFPILPLIGGGKALFSPVYVEDLVQSVLALIANDSLPNNQLLEACGAKTACFKELMQFILQTTGRNRLLINLPFSLAKIEATVLNALKIYLLTADQVELLKYDNVASGHFANIDSIIGRVKSYEEIVPQYLK